MNEILPQHISSLFSYLRLIKNLLHEIPARRLLALVNRTRELYSQCVPGTDWRKQHDISQLQTKDFQQSLGKITGKIIDEINRIRNQNCTYELDPQLRISLNLAEDDPDFDADNDNIILSFYCPSSLIMQKVGESPLLPYLYRQIKHFVSDSDIMRTGSIWVDIFYKYALGFKIENNGASFSPFNNDELNSLLFPYLQTFADHSSCQAEKHIPCLNMKILKQITSLESGISNILNLKTPANSQLEKAWKQVKSCINFDKDSFFEHQSNEYLNPINRKYVITLNRIMTIIEKKTVDIIKYETRQKRNSPEWDYELPYEHVLTFWTKNNAYPPIKALPFWEDRIASISLFTNPDNWSEGYFDIPMCYLSHVVFIDSDFQLSDLTDIDYVTWEMTMARQCNISVPS